MACRWEKPFGFMLERDENSNYSVSRIGDSGPLCDHPLVDELFRAEADQFKTAKTFAPSSGQKERKSLGSADPSSAPQGGTKEI